MNLNRLQIIFVHRSTKKMLCINVHEYDWQLPSFNHVHLGVRIFVSVSHFLTISLLSCRLPYIFLLNQPTLYNPFYPIQKYINYMKYLLSGMQIVS